MALETPYTPPVTRATVRRSAIMAAVVAVAGTIALVVTGYPLYALFFCIGLALGVFNSVMVMGAVVNYASKKPSRVKFGGSVLTRLAILTVIALGCAYFFRPEGFAVIGGLAVYQFLAVASSLLPLIKEIRKK